MKKRWLPIIATGAMLCTLAGCGGQEAGGKDGSVELSFMTNVVGEKASALEAAIDSFEKETGYTVEFSAPGSSYEELMKTKMSSNEMPDLFTTHGWSVARYSEYLEPIDDQPFADKLSKQIEPVITDKDGNMYVLPVDRDIAGIVYNTEALKKAGVDPDSIKTWADFEAACEKVKGAGITPIHMGGKDNWTIGQFFDWAAPSYYVTDDNDNKRDDLKEGKFDTKTWEKVAGMMDKWVKNGYFNQDVLTADYNSDIESLATAQTAFCFYGGSALADVKGVNPDAQIGFMPIPAANEGDEPSLIAGEDIAVGVWKDSKNKEAAMELLNYLAKPEVMSEICKAAGSPAGLDGVEVDLGDIGTYYEKYADVETFPYFDREYLPSGMWDVMCLTGADILAQKDNAVSDAAKVMQQNFNDKFAG